MSFASYLYLAFLCGCFVVHWVLPVSWRKGFLIAASYAFYASWAPHYCLLLFAVSLFSWAYGLWLAALAKRDASVRWLWLGVAIELLPLVLFKYSAFAAENLQGLAHGLGVTWQLPELAWGLPLGISFFTFQGIAYLVDVAAGEPPFRQWPDFLLYKAFWPQLVAGPIVRPSEIQAQIATPRTLEAADVRTGGRRILCGLFKKVVLADLVATYVDSAFVPNARPGAVDALAGILGFGLQIYWDFGGYSDIAIGSARLFGYRFPENFDWPYVSCSPQEFWTRWHMTLSRWIGDYVFLPISFALRGTRALGLFGLMCAMALCGLWHGAAWTFVLWGTWHGVLLVLNQSALKHFFSRSSTPGRWQLRAACAWLATFVLVHAGWLLFRARDLAQVVDFGTALLTLRGGIRPSVLRENGVLIIAGASCALLLAQLLREPIARYAAVWAARPRTAAMLRGVGYALALVLIIVFDREAQSFVYFQF